MRVKTLYNFSYQTGGSILAARLAVKSGRFSINVGGGFHHASAQHGGGFCCYADITLALEFLFTANLIKSAMIVDLVRPLVNKRATMPLFKRVSFQDAHQGNGERERRRSQLARLHTVFLGHENDFLNDERVYILDAFNYEIYPHDQSAKRAARARILSFNCFALFTEAIRKSIRLQSFTTDANYLDQVRRGLKEALEEFEEQKPGILIYNAGTGKLTRANRPTTRNGRSTDTLDGDPLGRLSLSDRVGEVARQKVERPRV